MQTVGIVFIAVAAAIALWLGYSRLGKSKVQGLEAEYRRRLRLSEKEATEVIERQLASLKEKFPDRSYEWYLEKMIFDLDRDRL
ncbi:MAG: hypothetical protein GX020_05375 [Firmicutes bacterium]|nr:hypothetical protein [Bacillota bacterium]